MSVITPLAKSPGHFKSQASTALCSDAHRPVILSKDLSSWGQADSPGSSARDMGPEWQSNWNDSEQDGDQR